MEFVKSHFTNVLIFFISLLLICTLSANASSIFKYRISLKDKSATQYSLYHPEDFLSQKSIKRREKQHLPIDSTDLPVCAKYVTSIQNTGVKIVAVGKWNNFVTIACNDSTKVKEIKKFPFVRSAELVWRNTFNLDLNTKRDSIQCFKNRCNNPYGFAYRQIQLCNGDKLHHAGYRGKGMVIAIIDAGYQNTDIINEMKNIKILGTHDFVNSNDDIYAKDAHGTSVLSIMAMNKPKLMIGTAPDASYWLLRSEDSDSESLVEQDYWAESIEFADSVGVDIVNTSLGYYKFDDNTKNYKYGDLNGKSTLISKEASMAANKGIVLIVAAGNEGSNNWEKITVPGDAENVLTVGAVDANDNIAPFSSVGNTADGRIKPDIVALGVGTASMSSDGSIININGTSFSTPIISGLAACLWQAYPKLTAKEIMNVIRYSGNRISCPDNHYGYGIPDMWKALQMAQKMKN